MRALRAVTSGQLMLADIPGPGDPGPGEVLVATGAVGVCGSDVHIWDGTQSAPMHYPVIMGHESMGVVAGMGSGVEGLAVGDRVVSETHASVCGVCPSCREGHYNLCPSRRGFGMGRDGAMAEFFVTRAAVVHRVPDSVPNEAAALTEPYCVSYNATVERARVRPGDGVAVIGPGPTGLFAAELARVCGAGEVLVAGLASDQDRLAVAVAMGVDITDEPAWWEQGQYRDRFDVVIDASGVSATLDAAATVVKPGGQIVKIGWGPEPYGRPLDVLVAKAVELHGSFSHTWGTWERVLRLIGNGQLQPARALRVYELSDWEKAFSAMANRHVVKAVLAIR